MIAVLAALKSSKEEKMSKMKAVLFFFNHPSVSQKLNL